MEDNKLFTEFPPVTTEKWEEVINKDLKGADYEKKLVWKTIEGFKVKPYYRAEDLEKLDYLDSNPAQYPYIRGKQSDSNTWDVRQDIKECDAKKANEYAIDALKRGATAIGFCMSKIEDEQAMEALLKDIHLPAIKIHFNCVKDYKKTIEMFERVSQKRGFDPKEIEGTLNWDIYKRALRRGAFEREGDGDFDAMAEMIRYSQEHLPKFRVLTVNGSEYHNAGSNIVQELGFTLSAANDLMAKMTDRGIEATEVAKNMVFNFATGSNYFMEIAKIRAARLLWSKVVAEYNPSCECAYKVFINATSSEWNKSIFDPYVNMLRTTTETMSAAVAGADSISTTPFDSAFKEADDFSYRIARNQQLLLKEESYLDKIVDPAAGSYYIENLTDSIAQYAWELFLKTEEKGGFAAAIRSNYVQEEIEKTAQQRDMDIATRRTTIVGTNQYPNLTEIMSEKVAKERSCCCGCEKDIEFKSLRPYRGAEAFERLRMATEQSGKRPKVFMLTYGNLAMRRARSGFATNFFGVAGYEIMDNNGFSTVEEGVDAALKSGAEIVVLCSSDDEYAEITEQACKGLKGKVKSIVLAGFPKEMIDTYKGYGVDEFVHVKTNVLDSLTGFQKLLGIME